LHHGLDGTMGCFIAVELAYFQLFLGEVSELQGHFFLNEGKRYQKVVELELHAGSLVFNLSLVIFNLFFKSCIPIEKHS
jgi:hypothetical protein